MHLSAFLPCIAVLYYAAARAGCFDEGSLRAYIDGELSEAERAALTVHLAGCDACGHAIETLRSRSQRVAQVLAAPSAPFPQDMLAQLFDGNIGAHGGAPR